MRRLVTVGLLCGAALGLNGCYVAPAGPAYYRPAPAAVYVAPRPYYGYPAYGYGYRGYGYYGRGYGYGWSR